MTARTVDCNGVVRTELIRQARTAGRNTAATYHSANTPGISETTSGDADEFMAARDSNGLSTPR